MISMSTIFTHQVQFVAPIKTISEANVMEHWTKRHKRHKQQLLVLNSFLSKIPKSYNFPIKIIITRIAPRELDSDNLTISVKFIRDRLADFLIPNLAKGQADSDKRLEWVYNQSKGQPKEYAIKITIIPSRIS